MSASTMRVLARAIVAATIAGTAFEFSIGSVLAAFVVVTLLTSKRFYRWIGPRNIRAKIHFSWDFIVDLAVSNFVMAWDVLTPGDKHQVRMIHVPIDDLTAEEIALLNHRITLTPGTLACGVSEDGTTMLVHLMYPGDNDSSRLRKPIDILKGNV
ncbi:Na+/H+ antiporter subunit E [bacterium]|nr:Na+/H+ antiporter subunit E [bacterium]